MTATMLWKITAQPRGMATQWEGGRRQRGTRRTQRTSLECDPRSRCRAEAGGALGTFLIWAPLGVGSPCSRSRWWSGK